VTAAASSRRTAALAPRPRLGGDSLVTVDVIARESGLHPELVQRLVRLGAFEPSGTRAAPLYPRGGAARLARAMRLRRDLGLNYAGALLACDLLARIDDLEARLRLYEQKEHRPEVTAWTRIS
jgi:hypothetical protein